MLIEGVEVSENCKYEPNSFTIKLPQDDDLLDMLKRCGARRIYPQLINAGVKPLPPLLNKDDLPLGPRVPTSTEDAF